MDVTPTTDNGSIFFRCFPSYCFGQGSTTPSITEMNKSVWKKFGYKSSSHVLPPIFAYLIDLYDGNDVIEGLESCRINPDYTSAKHLRNDLQYYIPQLTNFVVFHENFLCKKLTNFLEDASIADAYFAHCYYWYINSLAIPIGQQKTQAILDNIVQKCSGEPQTQLFTLYYEKFIWALKKKLMRSDYEKKIRDIETRKQQAQLMIRNYQDNSLDPKNSHIMRIRGLDLDLKPYVSPYLQGEAEASTPFTSTIIFLEDLYVVAEELLKKQATEKLSYLKSNLHNINKSLPSCIYIPFVKDSLRSYAILNIAVEETRVFSTKERAPFYLCLETFRPQEELSYEYNEIFRIEETDASPKTRLMTWAKKAIHNIKPRKKTRNMGEPDEHFKTKNIIELMSSPLTLQGVFKAQEEAKNMDDRSLDDSYTSTRQAAKSVVIHREKFLDFAHSEEFTPVAKYQGRLSIPNRMALTRKTAPEAEDAGISIAYQEDPLSQPSSYPASSYAGLRLHNQLQTEPQSFVDNSMNIDDTTARQEMRLSTTLNEPLYHGGNKSVNSISVNSKVGLKSESMLSEEDALDFFGEDSKVQAAKIRERSPFRHLKSWKLIHMIVKTGADMKEEQFAIQLISQFDQIFKDEKVNLILTPYEIISLGSDFGVMEAVKDAITMSRLKEKMYQQKIPTLDSFFDRYYGKEADIARKRFCRSLAAYSLVCYFLQVKDRHNGNILFHKLGHILHIDFGFLLTNSPGKFSTSHADLKKLGKGVEFEKKVPFKLLTEYVEVLGGPRSSLFQEFRKLFYRGFMAARKHREQILILVKMMYSTQGANLPCFKGGSRAITELEQRFCPPGVQEKDLMGYCYNLINQSLDNWRAKCYDKYQYHFQGIFY